jgi:hypothetical protein
MHTNFEIAPKAYQKLGMSWYDAKAYCSRLCIDGRTGWRLPTTEEVNKNIESFYFGPVWTSDIDVQIKKYNWDDSTKELKTMNTMPVRDR